MTAHGERLHRRVQRRGPERHRSSGVHLRPNWAGLRWDRPQTQLPSSYETPPHQTSSASGILTVHPTPIHIHSRSTISARSALESQAKHIHVRSLDVPLWQLELMYLRMSEERTSLIRLQEHAFTLQPDAVRVLIFSVYDFSECHLTRLISDPSTSLRMT